MSRFLIYLKMLDFLRFSNPSGNISQYDTSNLFSFAWLGKVNNPSSVMMRKFRDMTSSSRDEVRDVLIDSADIKTSEMDVLLRLRIASYGSFSM